MTLDEALSELEKRWGRNLGFYGIPPCRKWPKGGYQVNLIPKVDDHYVFGLMTRTVKIIEDSLSKAIISALGFIDNLEKVRDKIEK